MPKLILISGPSCIGKSPLVKGIGTLCPKVAETLETLVLSAVGAPASGMSLSARPSWLITYT